MQKRVTTDTSTIKERVRFVHLYLLQMKITPLAVSTLSILVSVACAQTSIPQSDIDAYKSLKSAFNAAAAPQLTQAEQDREAMHELLRADREALKGSAKYQEYLGKTHPVKKEVCSKVFMACF